MTRICCYCTPYYENAGRAWRFIRRAVCRAENGVVISAAVYFGAQLVRWSFNGFAIVR